MLRLFTILILSPLFLFAQTTPGEGASLNYRLIGFSFPQAKQITGYKIEMASGNFTNEDSFSKNISATVATKKNRVIAEVPDFGRQYTWRVVCISKAKTTNSDLHHFSTLTSPDINRDSTRLRMITPNEKYKDDYVFVDGNKVLYDMKGNPVWFFPDIDSLSPRSIHLRDLKYNPSGTLTTIVDERIYEINYNGNVLWRGPGNNKVKTDSTFGDSYHHEFMKLPNGHYMVMAFEQAWWRLPTSLDSATTALLGNRLKHDGNIVYQKMLFGTLLEFNKQGDIVWKWSGADYFSTSDLRKRMTPNNLFNLNDTHANAFYLDEKTHSIYISFRDINRILKIDYPSGKVLNTYGKIYAPVSGRDRDRHLVNGMFCGQHCCRLSSEGYLYLFNNNMCHRMGNPTIPMFKQPLSENDTLEKVWEFACPTDDLSPQERMTTGFNFGGSVFELPDKSMFVCMGGTYGKLFIVNRDKQLLWVAQPEKWDASENKWTKQGLFTDNKMREGSYRASIINRKELESLIWNEPLEK